MHHRSLINLCISLNLVWAVTSHYGHGMFENSFNDIYLNSEDYTFPASISENFPHADTEDLYSLEGLDTNEDPDSNFGEMPGVLVNCLIRKLMKHPCLKKHLHNIEKFGFNISPDILHKNIILHEDNDLDDIFTDNYDSSFVPKPSIHDVNRLFLDKTSKYKNL